MTITCLGVNGPFPAAAGATSGYFVATDGARIQLDLGSGTLSALTELTPPERLTALVLSHWHYDHCSDVLPLIFRMESLAAAGAGPLNIYAPVDENALVRQAVLASPALCLHDITPGDTLHLGDAEVHVYQARHPVPAVMLRISCGSKTLCYTGDTNEVDGLADFAQNADLLLADGLFPASMWAYGKPHLSAEKAAQLAADAQARQVVVTHLNPAIDPESLLKEARRVRPDVQLAKRFAVYQV